MENDNSTYTERLYQEILNATAPTPISDPIPSLHEFRGNHLEYYNALSRYLSHHPNSPDIRQRLDGSFRVARINPIDGGDFVEAVSVPRQRTAPQPVPSPTRDSLGRLVSNAPRFAEYAYTSARNAVLKKARYSIFENSLESDLSKQKKKYLHSLSYADAKKLHPFIDHEIALSMSRASYYYKKQFADGASFIFEHPDGLSMLDDRITFDTFKDSIRLCYIIGTVIAGTEEYTVNKKHGLFVDYYNRNTTLGVLSSIVSNSITGCHKAAGYERGTVVYYKPGHAIEFVRGEFSPGCDANGDIFKIVHQEDLPPTGALLQNLMIAIKKTTESMCTQVLEYVRDNEVKNRSPRTMSRRHRSEKKGLYISHSVPFSCEIECYGKDKRTVARFSHSTYKDLGMCHDGSLTSGLGYPIEIQTPILKGKRGEILIADLCTSLIEKGFKVDKSCGLHIHLDGHAFNHRTLEMMQGKVRPTLLITLYLAYRLFDPVIVSLLPSTRRANRYCSSFEEGAVHNDQAISVDPLPVSFNKMMKVKTLKDFENYWYKTGGNYEKVMKAKSSRYTVSRYFGVNIHSLLAHNNLEIRYHSGTLNYEKILYWIEFHGKLVEKVLDGTINIDLIEALIKATLPLDRLTETLLNILNLNSDTVEYLRERQAKFKDVVASEEILINKTKKVDNE